MAANFWESSQRRHWLFSREQLVDVRLKLKDRDRPQLPLPDHRLLNIYFSQQLSKLGKRMTARQQALATAQVYIKRFYTKVDMRQTNPHLVLTTAFYLACKMEECPHHIRANIYNIDLITPDVAKLGECEFALIAEMNSQLIVHHPYRTISDLQTDLGLTSDEVALAWSVTNDHYLTDLPLLYPPHVIAVMAMIIAVVFKPSQSGFQGSAGPSLAGAMRDGGMSMFAALGDKGGSGPPPRIQRLVEWLAESEVDIKAVVESTQELVSLYEIWEQYSEKHCKELLTRMVKSG